LRQRDFLTTSDIVLVVGANTGDDRSYLNVFQTFRISALDRALEKAPFREALAATA
jgi:hypothetical protein